MSIMYIVVNKHIVRSNAKLGKDQPVFRVSRGKWGKPVYYTHLSIYDGRLTYLPDHPLPCGASVWIEMPEDIFKTHNSWDATLEQQAK